MMNYRTFRLKIIVGYAVLASVLLLATWMVYAGTRSLAAVNKASEQLVERRNIVDSLVCSMLETANAERSVLLGDTGEWTRFAKALHESEQTALRLKAYMHDSSKARRLDTLAVLLAAKYDNARTVMQMSGNNRGDKWYSRKMDELRSAPDSMVLYPKSLAKSERNETVYNIVSTRRGFFRRLGDLFRRQHSDTIATRQSGHADSAAVMSQSISIGDSVAGALAQIHDAQRRDDRRRQDALESQIGELQVVSIQLARRTSLLLEDIQADEHTALRRAVDSAMAARHAAIMKVAALGAVAILAALVLIAYIMRDIKRERRDRQRIIEAKAETEHIMAQRERLLLTITHDIKAPAASISGFIALLDEWIDKPKPRAYLENIGSSASHLLQLVGALLDYHQLESGKAEIQKVSFMPQTLVADCTGSMMPQAHDKALSLNTRLNAPERMVCRGDAFRIRQIINNLVGNAIKYTDSGEVAVAMNVVHGLMTVSVSDTGCGMDEGELQRIFDAFTRLPGAQGKEGVGLGLSITREAVHMLGGTIRVNSKKGTGTKFTVSIPVEVEGIKKEEDKDPTVTDNTCKASDTCTDSLLPTPPDKPISVLVVDDDSLQLQLLGEMLARIGGVQFTTTATRHAVEAVETARRTHPQIILTDMEMPEMNGSDMLRAVRREGTKVVAMTAHDRSIEARLCKEGFDACLFKPFTMQQLADTISRLTGTRLTADTPDAAHAVLAPMLTFADGDSDAERQILEGMRDSIDEYLELLADSPDTPHIAMAAHKAMPMLEMLHPGQNEWLRTITPEHINASSTQERALLAERLRRELDNILAHIQSMLSEK